MNEDKLGQIIFAFLGGVVAVLLILFIAWLGMNSEKANIQSCMKSLNNIEYCLK